MPLDFSSSGFQLITGMMVKILPLYVVMALGFLYGKNRPHAGEPLAFLQIYFITPIFVVSNIANMQFQTRYLLLPLIAYLLCCFIGFLALNSGQKLWKDNTPNLFAHACGSANTGYYGVPVAIILFPPEVLALFILTGVDFTLFDCTCGFYWIARGNFTIRDSLRRLMRLPIIYAFTAGLVLSAFGQRVPDTLKDIVRDFRGCYIVLAALMIGIGLSRLQHFKFEAKPILFAFGMKFLLWPALVIGLIAFDTHVSRLFSTDIYKIFLLLAIMPLPANSIAYALQMNVQPDRASTLVFLSTLFALFYIPFVVALWG